MAETKKSDKITKEMSIGDVVKKYPETIPVFFQYGLHCIGCHVSPYESVEEGCKTHGIDVDTLIIALNTAVKEGQQRK